MDQQLKQRLVGIGVIFSLAVIFLPMLLDGSGQQREKLEIEIPPPPEIKSRVDVSEKIIEIQRNIDAEPELQPLFVDESTPTAEISQPAVATAEPDSVQESVPQSPPVKPPAADSAPATSKPEPVIESPKAQVGGESWVIQIGSFKERERAFKQRDRLRQSKLSAVFIEQFEQQKGELRYRVRMGPFIDKAEASVVRNKVLAKYNIKGLVMRYEK